MNLFFKYVLSGVVLLCISQSWAASPYPGYNFYASGTKCYLKDMNGNTIHTWTSRYSVMSHAYLLRDSSVLFPCSDNNDYGNGKFQSNVALQGGRFQIIKWDGTIAWDFPYHSSSYMPHHDCTFYYTTNDIKELPTIFTVAATIESDGTIAEKIVEIKPTGATTAEIKWEWKAFEHSTTSGTDKPELLDINKGYMSGGMGGGMFGKEWLHANHVRYNQQLDLLVIDLKYLSEFIIIDHSTTTKEASGHTGGKYGKGGDILYRWGNPANYGCSGTKYLSQQHAAAWVPKYFPGTRKLLPGAGNILVISNGTRIGYEVVLPSNNGVYPRTAGNAYGPSTPLKTINIANMTGNEGSITRLPNGNTLICKGMGGNSAAEYDSTGTSVWTMTAQGATELFRIDSSYLGSMILDTGDLITNSNNGYFAIKNSTNQLSCSMDKGSVKISFGNSNFKNAEIHIFSLSGKSVYRKVVNTNEIMWRPLGRSDGPYIVKVSNGDQLSTGSFYYTR